MSEQDGETESTDETAQPAAEVDPDAGAANDGSAGEKEAAADEEGEESLAEIVTDTVEGEQVTETVERPDPESVTVDEALIEEIRSADAETVALAVQLLRAHVDGLESALAEKRERTEDLESRLKRKQADFQNYKKRQEKRLENEVERATEDLVTRLLDVRDNLGRALEQDETADIRGGVESTLEQFDREFDRENVEPIEPEPGWEVDPQRHEVLVTVASDQPEDTIAEVHRPGYEMAGKVLRPAQVAVSEGPDGGDAGE